MMPKYSRLKPTDTFIFRSRFRGHSDPAAYLHQAIMKNDPEMKNAFTPEVARQYLGNKRKG